MQSQVAKCVAKYVEELQHLALPQPVEVLEVRPCLDTMKVLSSILQSVPLLQRGLFFVRLSLVKSSCLPSGLSRMSLSMKGSEL